MARRTRRTRWRTLLALMMFTGAVGHASGQTVTIRSGDAGVQVQVSQLRFIEGELLERLRDGRSAGVEFELTVMPQPGAAAVWQGRERFSLSFDIWEERFAVTRAGAPTRSASHLTARDAEAWCFESLSVPRAALATLGRDARFWIRLAYRIEDPPPVRESDGEPRFALRTLIDLLGRRREEAQAARSMEAGPFTVPY